MKRHLPWLISGLCLCAVLFSFSGERNKTSFNVVEFGRLPVLVNGRVKPFDTVARSSLLLLQGRQRVKDTEGRTLAPSEWLLDLLLRPEKAESYRVIEIVEPELLSLFGLEPAQGEGGKRFSLSQLRGRMDELTRQARMAAEVEAAHRDAFQRSVLKLHTKIDLHQRLRHAILPAGSRDFLAELKTYESLIQPGLEAMRAKREGRPHDEETLKALLEQAGRHAQMAEIAQLHPISPAEGTAPDAWRSVGLALNQSLETGRIDPQVLVFAALAQTWNGGQAAEFNEIVRLTTEHLRSSRPQDMRRTGLETLFNSAQPFYSATVLYLLAFLLAVASWIAAPDSLRRAAFQVLCLAFLLTSAGILARMWLESRPPVTNLYSSALFVGWGTVLLCLVLEYLFRNSLASATAGLVGFCTLIIAHHLSLGGDTMEMMRAVLDSNFWLATHVVTISIGYSATFLAGFLGLFYILRGALTRSLDPETGTGLYRMVYGIVCFATLFNVVGTVLGGIWADQSWGRFWGWDPKENGALIIVLWNAIMLHARWGGMVKRRGFMSLAVFGNIVTAWSWFGTNMLGVGLHSYGFTDAAFLWLLVFVFSQLAVIAVSALPPDKWRSQLDN